MNERFPSFQPEISSGARPLCRHIRFFTAMCAINYGIFGGKKLSGWLRIIDEKACTKPNLEAAPSFRKRSDATCTHPALFTLNARRSQRKRRPPVISQWRVRVWPPQCGGQPRSRHCVRATAVCVGFCGGTLEKTCNSYYYVAREVIWIYRKNLNTGLILPNTT